MFLVYPKKGGAVIRPAPQGELSEGVRAATAVSLRHRDIDAPWVRTTPLCGLGNYGRRRHEIEDEQNETKHVSPFGTGDRTDVIARTGCPSGRSVRLFRPGGQARSSKNGLR